MLPCFQCQEGVLSFSQPIYLSVHPSHSSQPRVYEELAAFSQHTPFTLGDEERAFHI